jgi:hypothetical protein
VAADNSSVVVNGGQTATNSGTFEDRWEEGVVTADTVRISASVGSVTQSGTRSGTWSWSYATLAAGETKTVTITATDSRGKSSRTSFSLTAKPANDSFSGAFELPWLDIRPPGDTTGATMEAGEPRPDSPTKDCGIYGVEKSVWFKITIPSNYDSTVALRFHTYESSFDTVLALYRGSSLGTLEQVECSNDNSGSGSHGDWTDALIVGAEKLSAGQTYYLQLSGTGGARSGKYSLYHCHDAMNPDPGGSIDLGNCSWPASGRR